MVTWTVLRATYNRLKVLPMLWLRVKLLYKLLYSVISISNSTMALFWVKDIKTVIDARHNGLVGGKWDYMFKFGRNIPEEYFCVAWPLIL